VLQRHSPDKQHLVILGPAEAPVAKIHNRYRWHVLLKATSSRLLHRCLHNALREVSQDRQQNRGVRLTVDIDPLTFL
jgi:primosomal protein N' (replication factor Y)